MSIPIFIFSSQVVGNGINAYKVNSDGALSFSYGVVYSYGRRPAYFISNYNYNLNKLHYFKFYGQADYWWLRSPYFSGNYGTYACHVWPDGGDGFNGVAISYGRVLLLSGYSIYDF